VVFTRKTDKYLTLQERADVVNNNHADLFICIHTNSAKSSLAFGSETFTLGLAKTKANLDVAMRENSVILLEDDYKTKYKGFDPASVESYIMFEFMQDKYIDKSIDLASTIQKQFQILPAVPTGAYVKPALGIAPVSLPECAGRTWFYFKSNRRTVLVK